MPKYVGSTGHVGLAPALALSLFLLLGLAGAAAQSLGGAGTLKGTVRDASGAPVPSAVVELSNPITGYSLQSLSGPDGALVINSIPPNTYRLRVTLVGFQPHSAEITIRTVYPIELEYSA